MNVRHYLPFIPIVIFIFDSMCISFVKVVALKSLVSSPDSNPLKLNLGTQTVLALILHYRQSISVGTPRLLF